MNNIEYGLIGKKLGHSLSKQIHPLLSDIDYQLIEIDDVDDILTKKQFKGLNVTIPYKETVMPYLDVIDENAKEIGCVNTIVNKNGSLYGYNTDANGFENMLRINNITLENKHVLILGNGGSSKTITYVSKKSHAKSIKYLVRTVRNKEEYTIDELNMLKNTQVIINTTPLGMYPNNYNTFVSLDSFSELEAVVDIIFNPLHTELVRNAKSKGIKAVGGLYMLVDQAAKAQEHYFNKQIPQSNIDKVYHEIVKRFLNIVLIGMPMSGKTTIGKELSTKQCMTFLDLDHQLEQDYNNTIEHIFSEKGEPFFRTLETQTVKKYAINNNTVISTGGGVILNEKNIDYLKQNGIIVFLDRSFDDLTQTDPENRPLLKDIQNLKKLYDTRYKMYCEYADIHIKNNTSIEHVVSEIEVKVNEILCNKWA